MGSRGENKYLSYIQNEYMKQRERESTSTRPCDISNILYASGGSYSTYVSGSSIAQISTINSPPLGYGW